MSKPNILTDVTAQSVQFSGNLSASNALTTSNIFASNVYAAGKATLTGIQAGRLVLSVTGNVFASNAVVTTNVFVTGNVVNTGTLSTAANIFAANAITCTNVFAQGNVLSTGVLTVGMTTLTVTGNMFSSNAITTGNLYTTNLYVSNNLYVVNDVTITGNVLVSNALTTTNIFATRDVTINQALTITGVNTVGRTTLGFLSGNVYVANTVVANNVYAGGQVIASGTINVANMTMSGNAIQTTNIWTTNVFSNVLSVTNPAGVTSVSVTQNVYAANTISVSNVYAAGNVYATGNVSTTRLVQATSGNIFVSNTVSTTNVFAAGNVSASFSCFVTGVDTVGFTTLNVPGNVFASNAITASNIYASGNIYATGNIYALGNIVVTGNVTVSNTCVGSNVFSNLFTMDGLYVTGNAAFSNAITAVNVFATNVWSQSTVLLRATTLAMESGSEGLTAQTPARLNNVPSYSDTFVVPVTSGLIGQYDITSWNNSTKVWSDLSGAGNNTTAFTGTPLAGTNYIYGGTADSLTWPVAILPTTYTFFHVARHSGTNRQQVFQGVSTNFFSGFNTNLAGVAYHGTGYLTAVTDLHGRNWVMSTDQNSLYRSNGVIRGSSGGDGLATRLGLNTGLASDWQCAEVLVYNRTLDFTEIAKVESYLQFKYSSFCMFLTTPKFGTPAQAYGANGDEFCDNIGLCRYLGGTLYPQVVANPPAPSVQSISAQTITSSTTVPIPILQYQTPIGPLVWTISGNPTGVYLSNCSSDGCSLIVPYLQGTSSGTVTVIATNRLSTSSSTAFSLSITKGPSPSFPVTSLFAQSTILTTSQLQTGAATLFTPGSRLFRASVNGYTASAFHSICNGQAPLFFVFKANTGYIATAYTVVAFNSVNSYVNAPNGTNYLNNLWNGSSINTSKYYNTNNPSTSLYDYYGYGPTFGNGHDLYIPDNCNVNTGYTYTPYGYATPGPSQSSLLFGNYSSWTITDYEVYTQAALFAASTILTTSQLQIGASSLFTPTTRLFRASVNGFTAAAFHNACNGQSPIFIVMRANTGYIATAYSTVAFNSIGNYTYSTTNYLNNLWNGSSISTTKYFSSVYPQYAIYDSSGYGPTFGGGHDMHLPDNCNVNGGYTNTPHSYSGTNSSLFFGNYNSWVITDYEVYI